MSCEKVLILSYYFPPSNFTAASRTYAYARYLKEFGYYPMIVTRNWDVDIRHPEDVSIDSGIDSRIEKYEGYEVHYMPFRGNFKDRFIMNFGLKTHFLQRKVLTAVELLLQSFTIDFIPYSNMYFEAVSLLQENKDIRKVIIVANPFTLFKFGYLLKKEFPYITWIADYRDDWNTQDLNKSKTFSILEKLESNREKKWVGTASYVTSVSDELTERIKTFVNKPGSTVANGYFEEIFAA